MPKPVFDDLNALNDWLSLRCGELANRPHPEQQDRTIAEVFEDERAELRPLGRAFDGYVEKTVRVRSTCLVQYANNRYSVPSRFAGQHVSLRAYAGRIVLVSGQDVIAEHKRRFTRNVSYFEIDLFAQPSFRPDAEAVADQKHPDQELRVDGWATSMAVEIRKVRAYAAHIDEPIN